MARVQVDERWLQVHDDLLSQAQDTARALLTGMIVLEAAVRMWEQGGSLAHDQQLDDVITVQKQRAIKLHDLLVAISKPW